MLRLKVLRILLPLLLVFLGVLLWKNWVPRTPVHREPAESTPAAGPRAEGLSVKEFAAGSDSNFEGNAAVFEPHDDGSLHLEGIRDLEIQREERGPLLVSAAQGDRTGEEGAWRWSFEENVEFREADSGLRLFLPALEIDDVAGVARSRGAIRFQGPDLEGRAAAVVYGLRGQPGSMEQPVLEDRQGGRMVAGEALLLDGIRDVELAGDVEVTQGARRMATGRLRLIRGPEDRLRQAVATQGVRGGWANGRAGDGSFEGDRLEVRWDGSGEVEFIGLSGEALLSRGDETLAGSSIAAARDHGGDAPWKVDATGDVYVRGRFGGTLGQLRAGRLQASFDENLMLHEAEARERVRFEGDEARAEAQRGTFLAAPESGGRIELFGDELHKARIARGRTRVAARTIRTDVRGQELVAKGLVEATLLPEAQESGEPPAGTRLFNTEQPIHFVSDQLNSTEAGARLEFTGSARGWQGERNLAAGTVVVDQQTHTLHARDAVSTRVPREASGTAISESDYLQIGADRADYAEAEGLAVYLGQVRVRMLEGWLEAERVEVELSPESRQVHEIRAFGEVRVEFHRSSEGEMERPISGTADRLLYRPSEAMVRLFGEQTPAAVRRIGEGGGTTTGRELHYRVDTGALDVESGEQGPGRIRS